MATSVPARLARVKIVRKRPAGEYDPDKVRYAMPQTAYSRDLYRICLAAEKLQGMIERFVDAHDGATITEELLVLGAIKRCHVRNEFFDEDVIVPAVGVIDHVAGFQWALNFFADIVAAEVVAPDGAGKGSLRSEMLTAFTVEGN